MKYELDPDWVLGPLAKIAVETAEAAQVEAKARGDTEKVEALQKAIEAIVEMGKIKLDNEWWG